MHRKVAGVIAAVVALGAAGCGGSNGSDGQLTRAEVIKRADEICADLTKRTGAAMKEAGDAVESGLSREEAGARIRDKIVSSRRDAGRALAALEAPDELKTSLASYAATLAESAELLPTLEDLQAGNDPKAQEREAVEVRARRLGRRIGFKVCG